MRIPYLVGGPCEGKRLPDNLGRDEITSVFRPRRGTFDTIAYSLTRLGYIEAFVCGTLSEGEERVSRLSQFLFDRAVPEECDDGNTTMLWGYEATLLLKDHTGQRLEMPLPITWLDPTMMNRDSLRFEAGKVLWEIDRAQREGSFYG